VRWRLGAAALLLTLTLTGSTYGQGEGGATIRIGAIFDLSGPTSDVGVPYAEGERAYITYANARNVVRGRRLELIGQDTSYNVARSEAFYQQLRTSGIVALMGWATADTEAFKGRVAADRLPYMSASYAEQVANPRETPYNFFIAPSYSQQMRIALRYIAKQHPNRRVKVVVYHHNSPFGESPLEDGRRYVQSKRLRIDYSTVAMPTGATDLTAQLTHARDADYIVVQNTSRPAAILAKDARNLGLRARIVLLNWAADELFVGLAGQASANAIGVQPFGTTGLKVPGLKSPADWLARNGGGTLGRKGIHFVQGWYTMAVMVDAIRRLTAQGREVNGPNIKAMLESMPAYTTGGVTARIKFSGQTHAGQRSSRIFQVTRGRFRQISGFTVP
jgi:branched-chain amino acid transport system substrate-binding protein